MKKQHVKWATLVKAANFFEMPLTDLFTFMVNAGLVTRTTEPAKEHARHTRKIKIKSPHALEHGLFYYEWERDYLIKLLVKSGLPIPVSRMTKSEASDTLKKLRFTSRFLQNYPSLADELADAQAEDYWGGLVEAMTMLWGCKDYEIRKEVHSVLLLVKKADAFSMDGGPEWNFLTQRSAEIWFSSGELKTMVEYQNDGKPKPWFLPVFWLSVLMTYEDLPESVPAVHVGDGLVIMITACKNNFEEPMRSFASCLKVLWEMRNQKEAEDHKDGKPFIEFLKLTGQWDGEHRRFCQAQIRRLEQQL